MPTEIFLSKANAEPEYDTIDEDDVLDTDTVVEHITEEPKEGEEGEPKKKAKIVRRPVSISDTHPLWTKNPSECTKDDYIDFYRKVFMDYKEPLFWIHASPHRGSLGMRSPRPPLPGEVARRSRDGEVAANMQQPLSHLR